MEQTGAKYGLGIDSVTAVELDPKYFPEKTKKIGRGRIKIKVY